MNIRDKFRNIAARMRGEFDDTKQALHRGGKGTNREDLVRNYLSKLLPKKYGMGKGEIVTSNNQHSKEIDIIIYDQERCPQLFYEESHILIPIESVYGSVQVKTELSSNELENAYNNIRSAKELISNLGFQLDNRAGMHSGMAPPPMLGVVIAFQGGRTIETIAKQVAELDSRLPDIKLRPDWIVVLDEGIIGPEAKLRGAFNRHKLPNDLCKIRKTKRYTWLRFYMQLIQELNEIILPPLDLDAYLKMPELIDGHRVSRHDHFAYENRMDPNPQRQIKKINGRGISKILAYCEGREPIPYRDVLSHSVSTTLHPDSDTAKLDVPVYEINPRNLPPLDPRNVIPDSLGRPMSSVECFTPVYIQIDGNHYALDFEWLIPDGISDRDDVDLDELFSM